MQITITSENINNYRNCKYNDITSIIWHTHRDKIDKKIINNFPNLVELNFGMCCLKSLEPLSSCTSIEILNCTCNKIISLEPLSNCLNFQILYCNTNKLTSLAPLSKFVNLRILDCSCGKLTSLDQLYSCVNLQEINCAYNQIKSLEPLSDCINLQILNCRTNKITSLKSLSNCVNLQKIICAENQIKSLKPLSNCVDLEFLYCGKNQIKSLELYDHVKLKELSCEKNKITSLESLSSCVNLQKINCAGNQIKSLEPLSNHINLHILDCGSNELTLLYPLSNCVNLTQLFCYQNNITSLQPLSNCVNLQYLDCGSNEITSLEPLSVCINLIELYCYFNQITSLEPISNCVNLVHLQCDSNQITSLEPLIYLRRLNIIGYSNNPIEIPTLQIQRMLDRIYSNRKSSIYNDNQNVHDTEIQRTVCESVQSLLKDPKNDFSIENVINSSLDKKTIGSLIEYCLDQTVHSVHLITYIELLALIWVRIQNSIHKTELMRILEEQIADSECKCFTGRFNRTLSVLVGFFDDIKINISNKSRISAIILNTKDKIIPYDAIKHKEIAINELVEAGYLEADFKDWIDAIDD